MKNHFSKRDKWIVGIGSLLLILLILCAQFYFLSPLRADLASKQKTLKWDQKVLDSLSKKKDEGLTAIVENTRELQLKVPVKPQEDQFLLDLEKAETISNSEIKSMGFSKDNQVDLAETNETANLNETDQQQSTALLPTGLKKLTVQLTVDSPSYDEFETFIETLESLRRVVVVESIQYTGSEEIVSLDQESEPFAYTLSVSAYYFPELLDLEAQLPKIDVPAPANKDNPLTQYPDSSDQ